MLLHRRRREARKLAHLFRPTLVEAQRERERVAPAVRHAVELADRRDVRLAVHAVEPLGDVEDDVGALATKLAVDTPLEEAVPYAVLAGAFAVTRGGAQGSLPVPEDVEKLGGR